LVRATLRAHASYTITGGLGGLGLRAAKLFVDGGASCVMLASRSGLVVRDNQGLDAQLRYLHSQIAPGLSTYALDISDAESVRAVAGSIPLSGLMHAASSFGSALMKSTNREVPLHMHGPKALGAYLLGAVTRTCHLHTALLMSSLAAMAISDVYQGTAMYAAANAYLDEYAGSCHHIGQPVASLQMANVGEQGSGALAPEALAALPGMVRIQLHEYESCLRIALTIPAGAALAVLPSSYEAVVQEFQAKEGPRC
jgi:hypothetical protein